MINLAFTEISIKKAFTFLEPGPVILVTTKEGDKNNIMTISWHMVMDFAPHIAISTGVWNHSFTTMMKTKDCVIAIPDADMIEKVIRIGTVSGTEVDKFKEFGLTPLPAKSVKAPLIDECIACIECKVEDYIEKHGIVVLEGIRLWLDQDKKGKPTFHANGDGTFTVDSDKVLNYRSMMEKWIPEGV